MQRFSVLILLILTLATTAFMYLIGVVEQDVIEKRRALAIARMATGLVFLWVLVGGGLMYYFRDRIRIFILGINLGWRKKFVLFATILACLEEVVTVSMTNLAPVFGSMKGEAFITASTNYFDVVALHSVIVFIPLFIALAIILSRYDFKPFSVFLIFGIVGTIGEALFAGNVGVFAAFPVWVFIYGLMVFLPAYTLPESRGARPVSWYHYILVVPAVFVVALPLLLPIVAFITGVLKHPAIHT